MIEPARTMLGAAPATSMADMNPRLFIDFNARSDGGKEICTSRDEVAPGLNPGCRVSLSYPYTSSILTIRQRLQFCQQHDGNTQSMRSILNRVNP